MRFGVQDNILQALINELSQCQGIKRAILFGSRARGDHRPNSDIDLAIDCEYSLPAGLVGNLDEAAGIYKIDVIQLHDITNTEMIKNIEREGIVIYPPPDSPQ